MANNSWASSIRCLGRFLFIDFVKSKVDLVDVSRALIVSLTSFGRMPLSLNGIPPLSCESKGMGSSHLLSTFGSCQCDKLVTGNINFTSSSFFKSWPSLDPYWGLSDLHFGNQKLTLKKLVGISVIYRLLILYMIHIISIDARSTFLILRVCFPPHTGSESTIL